MDKEIRNRIQRATQAARMLLEREYAEQLSGIFDIRADGTITTEPGSHLDAEQRVLRNKLVAAVDHRRAGGLKPADAVASYQREAAFTMLNRFVALKMLEARGLVQECISRGDQSAGFKEFTGLAPGLVQVADHGYRLYIESIFDDVGREVRVLFDRRDSAGILWPRRQALLDLVAILNAPDLAEVWKEDETIGWVYQYFNGDDERRQMRAESQAPRNSRELAVRNQFFTPRYVVEFLTDNTLGRIWYEMCQGKTRLVDKCKYLVRRPNEVFLDQGDKVPNDEAGAEESASQKELIKKTVFVPFRAKKDPRDITVLDPACGSGHFLLYAFDLFELIYEEAWEDDAGPSSEAFRGRLHDDYADLADLRKALPGLILRHNLHGIDIDQRATQIAALALWMRAQRRYGDLGIRRSGQPAICKTNIVVAEAMPGERDLRQEFLASLDPNLAKLLNQVFATMELAGEAGSLLRVEESIRIAVRDTYGEHGRLFQKWDEARWLTAESGLTTALHDYSHHLGDGVAYRRRMFAEDSERGFGFINLCRQRYDVILMNPPFGVGSAVLEALLEDSYPLSRRELASAFIERALGMASSDGLVGVIATRTPLFIVTYADWRNQILGKGGRIHTLVDLGRGVLDATVESAAYVVLPTECDSGLYFKALVGGMVVDDVANQLRRATSDFSSLRVFVQPASRFSRIPNWPIAYWVEGSLAGTYERFPAFESEGRQASSGASTNDDFRFLRLWCEVPRVALGASRDDTTINGRPWIALAKGGEYSPYYRNLELVINWRNDGAECKAFIAEYRGKKGWGYHWAAALNGYDDYFRAGVTWSRRTSTWISGRALPAGCIFGDKGPAAFVPSDRQHELAAVVAWMNSSVVGALLALSVGKEGSLGTARSNSYEVGVVERLPFPGAHSLERAGRAALEGLEVRRQLSLDDELNRLYQGPDTAGSNAEMAARARRLQLEVDDEVGRAFGIDVAVTETLQEESRLTSLASISTDHYLAKPSWLRSDHCTS
jgi:hypothetical protein